MALFSTRDLTIKFAKGGRVRGRSEYQTILESQDKERSYDIFLSHSYSDAVKIYGLKQTIEDEFNFSVFVDWLDNEDLSRENINRETARILQKTMKNCRSLIYAHSDESVTSKWMPWELGYFDALKNKVAILPIVKESYSHTNKYDGQEYLELYPYITKEPDKNGYMRMWVNDGTPNIYIAYQQWLKGRKPKLK